MNLTERFESKIFVAPDGCWLWTAAVNELGYGSFWFDGRMHKAHRIAYKIIRGNVSDDLDLDHLCRQPSCVNPYHLEAVTHTENVRRGKGTKTICEHGSGYTMCQEGCQREYKRMHRAIYRAKYKEIINQKQREMRQKKRENNG